MGLWHGLQVCHPTSISAQSWPPSQSQSHWNTLSLWSLNLQLKPTWSLKTLTLRERGLYSYSSRTVIQGQVSELIQVEHSGPYLIMRIMNCSWYAISTLCLGSASSSQFLRLCSGHPVSTPVPLRRLSVPICLPGTWVLLLNSRQWRMPYSLTWQQIFLTPTSSQIPRSYVMFNARICGHSPLVSLTHFPRIHVFCNFSFHSPCSAAGPDAQSTSRGVYPSGSIPQLFPPPSSSWLNPFHWVTEWVSAWPDT